VRREFRPAGASVGGSLPGDVCGLPVVTFWEIAPVTGADGVVAALTYDPDLAEFVDDVQMVAAQGGRCSGPAPTTGGTWSCWEGGSEAGDHVHFEVRDIVFHREDGVPFVIERLLWTGRLSTPVVTIGL
jgi:hypothetical protein